MLVIKLHRGQEEFFLFYFHFCAQPDERHRASLKADDCSIILKINTWEWRWYFYLTQLKWLSFFQTLIIQLVPDNLMIPLCFIRWFPLAFFCSFCLIFSMFTRSEEEDGEDNQRHHGQDHHHGDPNALPVPRGTVCAPQVLMMKRKQTQWWMRAALKRRTLVLLHCHSQTNRRSEPQGSQTYLLPDSDITKLHNFLIGEEHKAIALGEAVYNWSSNYSCPIVFVSHWLKSAAVHHLWGRG